MSRLIKTIKDFPVTTGSVIVRNLTGDFTEKFVAMENPTIRAIDPNPIVWTSVLRLFHYTSKELFGMSSDWKILFRAKD